MKCCDVCREPVPREVPVVRVHIFKGTDLVSPPHLDTDFCSQRCAISYARAQLDAFEKKKTGA